VGELAIHQINSGIFLNVAILGREKARIYLLAFFLIPDSSITEEFPQPPDIFSAQRDVSVETLTFMRIDWPLSRPSKEGLLLTLGLRDIASKR